MCTPLVVALGGRSPAGIHRGGVCGAGFLDEADAAALAEAERAGPHSNLSPAMAAAHSTHAFKKLASTAVKEFCDSEDYDEVARILSVRRPNFPLLPPKSSKIPNHFRVC